MEPEPVTNPLQPGRSAIFFNAGGLRPGWSLLLFLMMAGVSVLLLSLGAGLLVRAHLLPKPDAGATTLRPGVMLAVEALQFVCIAIPALLMARLERRSLAQYGLARPRMWPHLLSGLGCGVLALSLLAGVLWLAHGIAFDGVLLSGAAIFLNAAEWAAVFLLVGLFEEFLFRGYLQFTLARAVAGIVQAISPGNPHRQAIGFWIAAFFLSGCAFAAVHLANSGETAVGVAVVALAGMVFVFSLWRTGSLWWAIGFHSAWDWAQSYLYGTPDSGSLSQGRLLASHPLGSRLLSGGTDGPEGSVLVIPTLLLVALIIHLTLPARGSSEKHVGDPCLD